MLLRIATALCVAAMLAPASATEAIMVTGAATVTDGYGATHFLALHLVGENGRALYRGDGPDVTIVPDCVALSDGLEGGSQLMMSGQGSDGARYHIRILENRMPSPDLFTDQLGISTAPGPGPCQAETIVHRTVDTGEFAFT